MHSIGAAARMSGVTIETIRYYEREGIVPEAERSVSGWRLYAMADIGRLRFIKRCREFGFPIADIRSLLALSVADQFPCEDAQAIGRRNLTLVRQKIGDLKRIEADLHQLVGLCDSGTSDCPMLRSLFAD